MNKLKCSGIVFLTCCAVLGSLITSDAKTGIINTKHNLSFTGPGEVRALSETRICIFCHTPHNAAPQTPLWNRKLEPITYKLYSSSTMSAASKQPTGPTKLCLSCHDGILALGAVLWPLDPLTGAPLKIEMKREITSDRRSYIGTSLVDDHPVSFSYYDSLPNPELSPTLPTDLLFYGIDEVHCSTCHDAHENENKKFLAVNNENSGLCLRCHIKDGWTATNHNLSTNIWNGAPPDPWPRTGITSDFSWQTVQKNGCENCHTPHTAGGPNRLLNYPEEEQNCYPCHNGNVASKNIEAQFTLKTSRHPVALATGVHDPTESPALISGHVECADCHNSHVVNSSPAVAPYVSGRLQKVSGVSLSDGVTPALPAQFEYEICLKCHASSASQIPFIPRVVNETNKSVQFNTINPSYHPVAGVGRNLFVPSIPGSDMEMPPNLSVSSIIYCTDCHSDESVANGGSGSRGPHGSQYAPILNRQYETAVGTIESYQNYNLCYRCHSQTSILNDESFKKNSLGKGGHSGHLGSTVNAPCSVCHDPHGVRDDGGLTGDHSHLINFDTRYVTGPSGSASPPPVFTVSGVSGMFSGSCTLICHGKTHDDATTFYP